MKKRVAAVFAEDDDDEEESFAREQEEERRKEMLASRKRAEKRNLDIFMEELKSSNGAGAGGVKESMKFKQLRMDSASASISLNDDTNNVTKEEEEEDEDIEWERSTNIHISNIPMGINETDLCNEFGVFGPIASVKIMWPRGMDSSALSLSGFVSFMVREDAARAIAEMDGKRLAPASSALELKVGWGKPLQKLPKIPFFVHPSTTTTTTSSSSSRNVNLPGGTSVLDGRNSSGMIRIEIPFSIEQRRLIHRLVERVLVHGPAFEAAIMARERENPDFEFLSNPNCASHLYYRNNVTLH